MFMGLARVTCLQLDKCVVFFDRFFPWSFWSSSTLPRLVVLHCVLLSACIVLCCVVLLCVVICLLLVTLVCWLKISQFSCKFLRCTTRRNN